MNDLEGLLKSVLEHGFATGAEIVNLHAGMKLGAGMKWSTEMRSAFGDMVPFLWRFGAQKVMLGYPANRDDLVIFEGNYKAMLEMKNLPWDVIAEENHETFYCVVIQLHKLQEAWHDAVETTTLERLTVDELDRLYSAYTAAWTKNRKTSTVVKGQAEVWAAQVSEHVLGDDGLFPKVESGLATTAERLSPTMVVPIETAFDHLKQCYLGNVKGSEPASWDAGFQEAYDLEDMSVLEKFEALRKWGTKTIFQTDVGALTHWLPKMEKATASDI